MPENAQSEACSGHDGPPVGARARRLQCAVRRL